MITKKFQNINSTLCNLLDLSCKRQISLATKAESVLFPNGFHGKTVLNIHGILIEKSVFINIFVAIVS